MKVKKNIVKITHLHNKQRGTGMDVDRNDMLRAVMNNDITMPLAHDPKIDLKRDQHYQDSTEEDEAEKTQNQE